MLLYEFLKDSGLSPSLSNSKRVMAQEGVKVNGETVSDMSREVQPGDVVSWANSKLRKVK